MSGYVTHKGKRFPIMYCGLCGHTIECPECGNNQCNGGSGTVDGKQCRVCDDAYDAMIAHDKFLRQLDK